MLVLTRNIGDRIMIGDDIELVVVGVQETQVRLGVDAPRSVAVHREEIYDRIQSQRISERSGSGAT